MTEEEIRRSQLLKRMKAYGDGQAVTTLFGVRLDEMNDEEIRAAAFMLAKMLEDERGYASFARETSRALIGARL